MRNERDQELIQEDGSFNFKNKNSASDAWFNTVKSGENKMNKKLEEQLYKKYLEETKGIETDEDFEKK